jgi:hypothetical protein
MSPTHRSLPYNRSCQLRSGSHSTTPLNPFRRAGFAHLTRGISRAATAACTEGEGASEGGTHSVEVESFLRAAFSPPFTQFYARAPHCRMQPSCAVPHPADARHRALVVRWCPPFQRKISSKFGISERRGCLRSNAVCSKVHLTVASACTWSRHSTLLCKPACCTSLPERGQPHVRHLGVTRGTSPLP